MVKYATVRPEVQAIGFLNTKLPLKTLKALSSTPSALCQQPGGKLQSSKQTWAPITLWPQNYCWRAFTFEWVLYFLIKRSAWHCTCLLSFCFFNSAVGRSSYSRKGWFHKLEQNLMLKLSNTHKSFSRSPAEASEDNFTVLRNFFKNKVRRKSLALGWGNGTVMWDTSWRDQVQEPCNLTWKIQISLIPKDIKISFHDLP